MLLNGLVAWNQASLLPRLRISKMPRYEFYKWVADDFLQYKAHHTEYQMTAVAPARRTDPRRVVITPEKDGARCIVCRLDANYSRHMKGLKRLVVFCKRCKVNVHNHVMNPEETRSIHASFPGMTCHEIFRSERGMELWKTRDLTSTNQGIMRTHPILRELRAIHGPPQKKRTKIADVL